MAGIYRNVSGNAHQSIKDALKVPTSTTGDPDGLLFDLILLERLSMEFYSEETSCIVGFTD